MTPNEVIERALDLVDDLLFQNTVLRAERDEARHWAHPIDGAALRACRGGKDLAPCGRRFLPRPEYPGETVCPDCRLANRQKWSRLQCEKRAREKSGATPQC
jgi:hypothetical protein